MDSLHEFCGLCRQCDGEPAALAGAAVRGDRSAVQLHDALTQRKPQTAAVGAAVGVALIKLFKDARKRFRVHAAAGILHRDGDGIGRGGEINADAAARGSELHGVFQKIRPHLIEKLAVADIVEIRYVGGNGESGFGPARLELQYGAPELLAERENLRLSLDLPVVDARETEHIVDKPGETVGFLRNVPAVFALLIRGKPAFGEKLGVAVENGERRFELV